MTHWRISAAFGLLLTGRPIPICAIAYAAPNCAARRAFIRATDWWFCEDQHARRIWLTWRVGRAIRAAV
ncbi:hypothetical protein DRW48_10600 [Paracoccus suum]|uniref:Uncharacterized protein n=1 Tax=Paracoccus suum TaxID=2259340 RepID=A0A344PL29_9RHOB|nr:hypothetical protein [Paracoccus suum]AXC50084.1 hypothetical protein DRW48_10600 [Paracoccus suum]